MERFVRICLTWFLSGIIGLVGTLWVNAKDYKESESVNLELNAQGAALIDADTGRLLLGKNENEILAMASTTKIMTCLVALENSDLQAVVEISEYAASMPDVQLDAVAGDQFYMKDLLYALMLESHNDVAVAIAEYVGGSEEGFAKMMNERAESIGCENTHFVTTNGLDADGHYTTAAELAKIAAEAIKNENFVTIINTPVYNFTNIEGNRRYQVNNKDSFLNMMEGAFGIKTGFTNDAGYCFVGAVEQNGRTYISTVLGSGWPPNKNYKWQDTIKLMNYGLENYTLKKVGIDTIDAGEMDVQDGIKDTVKLKVDCQKNEYLLCEQDEVSVKMVKDLRRQAPIEKNEVVGWIYYQVNGVNIEQFPVYTSDEISKKTWGYCMRKVFGDWICF